MNSVCFLRAINTTICMYICIHYNRVKCKNQRCLWSSMQKMDRSIIRVGGDTIFSHATVLTHLLLLLSCLFLQMQLKNIIIIVKNVSNCN